MMFRQENALLFKGLKPDSRVWEWGSGTSTLYYSQCVRNWTSIEHHHGWCKEMQSVVPPNVEVRCVGIEPEATETFGNPGKWDGSKKEFKSYVNSIHAMGDCMDCIDVLIVDGRARKDCAIEALPYLREDSVVFVHDWVQSRMKARDQYIQILDYYDEVEKVHVPPPQRWRTSSGLIMLKPKPGILAKAKKALLGTRQSDSLHRPAPQLSIHKPEPEPEPISPDPSTASASRDIEEPQSEGAQASKQQDGSHKAVESPKHHDISQEAQPLNPQDAQHQESQMEVPHPKKSENVGEKLKELKNLKAEGLISEAEFETAKAKLIQGLTG
mmetsp:Transcript_33380/g.51916  ORF Transcript_33380/g.51916 Transcript_33380/m.51916 type:complete len:327 (-) Transcript_33380:267-1247(-)